MKTFMTMHKGGRFRSVNLEQIAFVDFVSLDENPETPERCTIHFVGNEKSVSLDNPPDVKALLESLARLQS